MAATRRRWTAEEVRALTTEERAWPRYELIAGELLVTPGPATKHQIATTELWSLLDAYLEVNPIGVVVTSPSELQLRPGTITQPDVFVVPADTRIAGDALEWPDVKSLLLAVEVLSPSSIRTDRVRKRRFYLDNGVEEYWIVDLDARVVERWLPEWKTAELLCETMTWTPRSRLPLVIDLPAYFARIDRKLRMFDKPHGS